MNVIYSSLHVLFIHLCERLINIRKDLAVELINLINLSQKRFLEQISYGTIWCFKSYKVKYWNLHQLVMYFIFTWIMLIKCYKTNFSVFRATKLWPIVLLVTCQLYTSIMIYPYIRLSILAVTPLLFFTIVNY